MSHISTNKLSPQILAENHALKLVSEHELLRDTIYKYDLGLLYTVSKTFLVSFNFQTRNVDLLLQVPLIKTNSMSTLLEVINFGFLYHKVQTTISLPRFVFTSGNEFLEIEEQFCSFENYLYVCKPHSFRNSQQASCITELIYNHTFSTCQLQTFDSNTNYIYRYTDTGLLLSSLVPFHRTYKSETGISHSKPYENTNNASLFFHYNEFEHIIFKDMILPSKMQIQTATHHLVLNNTELLPILVENSTIRQLDKLTEQLNSIKMQGKQIQPLEFDISYTNIFIIIFVVILFLVIAITLGYVFYVTSKRIKILEEARH